MISLRFLSPLLLSLVIASGPLAALERHSDPDGCFSCHGLPGLEYIDEQGVRRVATILKSDYYGSLHGSVPCKDCHRKIERYPHKVENGYVDCSNRCHVEEPSKAEPFTHRDIVEEFMKSAHGSGRYPGATEGFHGGNRLEEVTKAQNPSCRRCHFNEPYIKPQQMNDFKEAFHHTDTECGTCHQGEVWRNQFAGHILRRLVGKHYGKNDANKMCIDCHGDHKAMKEALVTTPDGGTEPARPRFVFAVDSYAKMLHGRLLEVGVEDGAACIDCHAPEGFRHDIQQAWRPTSATHPVNLAQTCSQAGCHDGYSRSYLNQGFLHTDVHDIDWVPLKKLIALGYDPTLWFGSHWALAAAVLGTTALVMLLTNLVWGMLGREKPDWSVLGGLSFQRKMLEMDPPRPDWYLRIRARWPGSRTDAGPAAVVPVERETGMTILYGSQTGNGEGVAEELHELAEAWQMRCRLVDMADYDPTMLVNEGLMFVIVSTQGDGEPPMTAQKLYAYLQDASGPRLAQLKYGVFALGDSSYPKFCQCGKDFDAFLERLGAERILERVDADVDFEESARQWMDRVLEKYREVTGDPGVAPEVDPRKPGNEAFQGYDKGHPFPAQVLVNRNLNQPGSNKETRHIEISLEGSGFNYEPGDVLGVYPKNGPRYVEALLQALQWDGYQEVNVGGGIIGEVITLREAFYSRLDITQLSRPLLENYAGLTGSAALEALLADEEKFTAYVEGRQLLDLVTDFRPAEVHPQQLVEILRRLPPRLYSIASSLKAHPGQVHLTVGVVRYHTHDRDREGVCSNFLARLAPGDKASIYLQVNPHFRLPSDPDTPIVMVGPGTGIAPFRAFVEEREATGAGGKNWLFFGDQHKSTDFLYQEEWEDKLKRGVLTRMDLAFSRDQERRVYVQDRMLENARELYAWLVDEGACFYVCGDASRMAKDVHQALIQILQQGGMDSEQAEEFLETMENEHRYQRDVY